MPASRAASIARRPASAQITLSRTDGAFYAIGLSDSQQLCPLADLDTPEDLHWAEQWVSVLCEEQGVTVTQREAKLIRRALEELASIPGDLGTDRRLTDLLPHLQDDALEGAVEYYAKGAGAQVLNGPRKRMPFGRFTTFELSVLLTLDPKIVNPTLLYLFRQVMKRLDGRFTLIQIAEAWAKLNHPRFYPFVEELLNTARKKNAFVVMDTQQPAQGAVGADAPRIRLAGSERTDRQGGVPAYRQERAGGGREDDAGARRAEHGRRRAHLPEPPAEDAVGIGAAAGAEGSE